MQWHYVDHDKVTKGPVITRMILHKVQKGDLDGMTLVFNGDIGEWKPISEIPELKAAILKQTEEEEAAQAALEAMTRAQNEDQGKSIQVFADFDDDGPTPAQAYMEMLAERYKESENGSKEEKLEADGVIKSKQRRAFTADNGIRYCWDDDENDWIEDDAETEDDSEGDDNAIDDNAIDDNEDDSDGDNGGVNTDKSQRKSSFKASSAGKKSKETCGMDGEDTAKVSSADDGAGDASGDVAVDGATAQKRKRNRKKKARKIPNHWVYITGLPTDVTIEEMKAHFSKVSNI